ncbi:MAG: UDP-N-acetylglucosamine 2-epimerase (non-hydrolyzing) [Acidobacteriaceae bacterium]
MKFVIVAGARPNFMKIAPILEAFRRRLGSPSDPSVLLVHTGQHYDQDMSGSFFEDLRIPRPDINLDVGSASHAEQTARIMIGFERVCLDHRPDWVIVVGDVNSTVACAITAKKLGIKVAHVEAGLRSHDMTMPEEINRLCTDVITDLLFTTDVIATENLRREGNEETKIHFVGNTMIDSLLRFVDDARSMPLPEAVSDQGFAVLTLHRPSNVDSRSALAGIVDAVQDISAAIPVLFPVHPRTLARLQEFGLLAILKAYGDIRITRPLSYLPFLSLVSRSRLVLTDSGGIQEETTVLGIPCLTLRSNTERPVTCDVGTNVLVGSDPQAIRRAAFDALSRDRGNSRIPDKWDGQAAERIVEILLQSAPSSGAQPKPASRAAELAPNRDNLRPAGPLLPISPTYS